LLRNPPHDFVSRAYEVNAAACLRGRPRRGRACLRLLVVRCAGYFVNTFYNDYIETCCVGLVHCVGSSEELAFVRGNVFCGDGIERESHHIILADVAFAAVEIHKKMLKAFPYDTFHNVYHKKVLFSFTANRIGGFFYV
jgi:hypothetical protein